MATITEYDFTQQIDYPNILVASIQNSSIVTPLVNMETIGSGPTMEVSLFFSDVLSSQDQTTLNTLMSSYVNAPSVLQSAIDQVNKDIAFGMSVIANFSANNRIANLNTTQIIQIATELAPIQALLTSGSITTALVAIQSLTPNTIITQTVINNYSQLLQNYLNGQ